MCMNIIERRPRYQRLIMAVALCVLAAGCGQDQIFGNVGTAALEPSVTAETPARGEPDIFAKTVPPPENTEPAATGARAWSSIARVAGAASRFVVTWPASSRVKLHV